MLGSSQSRPRSDRSFSLGERHRLLCWWPPQQHRQHCHRNLGQEPSEAVSQQPTRTGLATAGVVMGSVYLCLAACVAAYAFVVYNALHSVVGPNGR